MNHFKRLFTRSASTLFWIFIFTSIIVAQPDVKLHIEGSAQFDKIGPALGRLILRTASPEDPGRYGILFSNNTVAPFVGEDIGNQKYDFYSLWSNNRNYDAILRIHGKATNAWGNVLQLTHDGDDGYISTDVGDILLEPGSGTVIVEGFGQFNGSFRSLAASVISRNFTTNTAIAINSNAEFDDNQAIKYGMSSRATGDGLIHYGISTLASDASTNYGIRGQAIGNNSINGYGVYGLAEGTATNKYGVYGVAQGNGGTKYGIYGSASGTGINYAGYFDGDVFTTGSYLPSDIRLKTNLEPAPSSLAKIAQLPVQTYNYKIGSDQQIHLPESKQTGLVAQDVEALFPELIKEIAHPDYPTGNLSGVNMDPSTFKGVNYTGLIPHLIKAIQEQQAQLDHLTTINQKLTQRISNLEAVR